MHVNDTGNTNCVPSVFLMFYQLEFDKVGEREWMVDEPIHKRPYTSMLCYVLQHIAGCVCSSLQGHFQHLQTSPKSYSTNLHCIKVSIEDIPTSNYLPTSPNLPKALFHQFALYQGVYWRYSYIKLLNNISQPPKCSIPLICTVSRCPFKTFLHQTIYQHLQTSRKSTSNCINQHIPTSKL